MASALPLTDLQRIELAFPAAAMLHVVDRGADAAHPRMCQVRLLLLVTLDEALGASTERERRKLQARLDRALRAFLAPLVRGGGRVDAVGLVAWRMLEAVLEADVLVLPEGIPLSDALAALRPALQRAADVPEVAAAVARDWPAALARLQALGLYEEVGAGRAMAA